MLTNFDACLVVELVELEVLPATDEDVLGLVEGGAVDGAGDGHLLRLLECLGIQEDHLGAWGGGEG